MIAGSYWYFCTHADIMDEGQESSVCIDGWFNSWNDDSLSCSWCCSLCLLCCSCDSLCFAVSLAKWSLRGVHIASNLMSLCSVVLWPKWSLRYVCIASNLMSLCSVGSLAKCSLLWVHRASNLMSRCSVDSLARLALSPTLLLTDLSSLCCAVSNWRLCLSLCLLLSSWHCLQDSASVLHCIRWDILATLTIVFHRIHLQHWWMYTYIYRRSSIILTIYVGLAPITVLPHPCPW